MSGRRVLALYAALLFGFAGVLCRLFYLASRTDYAARAAAQSTVTLELPARRGGFYDCMGLPLTGLEKRWTCFSALAEIEDSVKKSKIKICIIC